MASTLRSSLESLVTRFVDDILSTVRSGLEEAVFGEGREDVSPRPSPKRTRARRRNLDLSGEMERIVAAVRRHEGGIRAEEIRKELGLEKGIFVRAVQRLLADRQLRKTGEKRRTTYFVAGKRGPRPRATTPAKASRPRRPKAAKRRTAKSISDAAKPPSDRALLARPSGAASEAKPASSTGKRRAGRAAKSPRSGKSRGRKKATAATENPAPSKAVTEALPKPAAAGPA